MSTIQRLKKATVYVDVPPSPYCTSRVVPLDSVSLSTNLKENEPWRVSHSTMQSSTSSSSLKRKLSYSDAFNQPVMSFLKKPKLTEPIKPTSADATNSTSYIYCHQCGKKRDSADTVHCTFSEVYATGNDRPSKTRRCHNKYCKSCLKNRYGEDMETIKAPATGNHIRSGQVGNEPYDYKCPKCRDVCNCSRCRKAKGLDPTGKFPNPKGTIEKKEKTKPLAEASTKSNDSKPKRGARQKSKLDEPLPTLNWTKLRTNLSVEDAEARFHIREFVLRFFSKAIPKAHLDELEQINRSGRNRHDEEDITSWVSEACLKSILLAFLGVLSEEETNEDIKKAIQMGIKEMRAAGLGLSKIWLILSSLRDSLDVSEAGSSDGSDSTDSETIPTFPDPLPLPQSAINNSRRTRSTGALIVDTVQMIPVVNGLIDAIVESTVIRSEIEKGVKEGKDVAREVRDATKNANDRWDKAKKETENVKEQEAKREAHKHILQDIEGASKVAMHRFSPRFSPLGVDRDGRLYYALSPNIFESDYALDFIASMAAETVDGNSALKARRKRRPKREEERRSLKDFSWFIAVRGKKPLQEPGSVPAQTSAAATDDDDDESDDDGTVDNWWAIWQPAEVRKLVRWITIKYGLNDKDTSSSSSTASSSSGTVSPPSAVGNEHGMEMSPRPSKSQLLALVGNLEEYAMSLDFRLRDGDTPTIDNDVEKGKEKAS
ncbi:hypothetical protein B0H10DRAFT_1812616 [Mycena sp. CBHHK59/15]|nr:hypothetical protein B0H10DRAFT_1812616 [Mycena sp. CBHHK59/15]